MPGLVPGIHVLRACGKNVDGRAFAAPKGLRPAGGTGPAMTQLKFNDYSDATTGAR